MAEALIWKEITTAFKGTAIKRSYAVEDAMVIVRTPYGEKGSATRRYQRDLDSVPFVA